MKITLSIAEITALVCNRYNLPADTEVEIKRPGHSRKYAFVARDIISRMVDGYSGQPVFVNGTIPGDKKISAIKALRTILPGLGLADAKTAVENWNQFIDYVESNGLPPNDNFLCFLNR